MSFWKNAFPNFHGKGYKVHTYIRIWFQVFTMQIENVAKKMLWLDSAKEIHTWIWSNRSMKTEKICNILVTSSTYILLMYHRFIVQRCFYKVKSI